MSDSQHPLYATVAKGILIWISIMGFCEFSLLIRILPAAGCPSEIDWVIVRHRGWLTSAIGLAVVAAIQVPIKTARWRSDSLTALTGPHPWSRHFANSKNLRDIRGPGMWFPLLQETTPLPNWCTLCHYSMIPILWVFFSLVLLLVCCSFEEITRCSENPSNVPLRLHRLTLWNPMSRLFSPAAGQLTLVSRCMCIYG